MNRLFYILIIVFLLGFGSPAECSAPMLPAQLAEKFLQTDSARIMKHVAQLSNHVARTDLDKTYFRSQDLPDEPGISKGNDISSAREEIRVEPSSGNYLGGCDNKDYYIEISGGEFGNGWDISDVTICGVEVCQIVMQSANAVVVYPGCGMPGTGDIVINSESKGTTVIKNGFTYQVPKPTKTAGELGYSPESNCRSKISWERGDGEACVVFMKQASSGSVAPSDRYSYQASDVFGQGSQIGSSEWFCVYNGTGNSVTVKKLIPGADYVFEVIEYNGQRGFETYLNPDSTQQSIYFRQNKK